MMQPDGVILCDVCANRPAKFRLGPDTTGFEMGANMDSCVECLPLSLKRMPQQPCAIILLEAAS